MAGVVGYLSPAYVIALELARHFCFGCSLTDYDITIIITQDYAAAKSFSVLGDIFRTMVAAMVKW